MEASDNMDGSSQNNSMNLQDHAWRYFELHANQRISLFRLYIAILVFYTSAIGFLFVRFYYDGVLAETAVIFLSIAFMMLTRIFRLLDERNCQLIEYGEKALRELESFSIPQQETTKIFTLENQDKGNGRSKFSYGECFTCLHRLAYGACMVAISLAILSILYFKEIMEAVGRFCS